MAINGVLILALAGGGYYAYTQINPSSTAAPVRTVTAAVGTVTSSVAASGKVTSPGDVGLVFTSNGVLTSVRAQVGQKVKRGQLLATIDNTNATNALAQAQSSYRKSLLSVTTATENVKTAQTNLATATQTAQNNLDLANQSLASTQALLANNAAQYQMTLDQARATLVTAQQNFDIWNGNYQLSVPLCSVDTPPTGCSSWLSAYNAVQSAQKSYDSSVLTNKANLIRDAQTLQSAQNAVTTAQAGLSVTSATSALKSAQDAYANLTASGSTSGSVTDSDLAALQVRVAQKNLAGTKLIAPAEGIVAAVAGKVGDISTSTQAGGINGFIILTDVAALQVQAGFSEADSANVRPNAAATFTFDALPNASGEGTVISVAPLPVTANSVNTYTVTFTLNSPVQGLKPGMTANATLIVATKSNVLAVPDTALTTRGGRTTVTLLKAGVQSRVAVTVGLKGDSETEITSGLKEGDVLVLPTVIAASGGGFPTGGVPGAGTGTLGGAGAVGGGGAPRFGG